MVDALARALEAGDHAAVMATVAPDVTLRVAVHDATFEGAEATSFILGVVLDGVLSDVRVEEAVEGRDATVLLFGVDVAGYAGRAQGALVTRVDAEGRVSELTLFLRPLPALLAVSDEVGRRTGGPPPEAGI